MITTVDLEKPQTKLPAHAAAALRSLIGVIDDPKAKARIRLEAMQRLKQRLAWLSGLVETQQTAPDVRQEIIEVLRNYRRSKP
jgi:hypothetical protein